MSHMSLLRFVFTLIVCPQEEYVEGVHRSRRVEVPQNQGGHYHVLLRAMPVVPMYPRLQARCWLSSTGMCTTEGSAEPGCI